jgi:hypothetical protein
MGLYNGTSQYVFFPETDNERQVGFTTICVLEKNEYNQDVELKCEINDSVKIALGSFSKGRKAFCDYGDDYSSKQYELYYHELVKMVKPKDNYLLFKNTPPVSSK